MWRLLEDKHPGHLETQIREHEAEGWVRDGKVTIAHYPYGTLHLQLVYLDMGEGAPRE